MSERRLWVRGYVNPRGKYPDQRKNVASSYEPDFIARAALDWPGWDDVTAVRVYADDGSTVLARARRGR